MQSQAARQGHESRLTEALKAAHVLSGSSSDYDPLLRRIGDARFVLLGEASHGTEEFYRERAEITKRLILDKVVTAVAAEADWPDAYRVNRYVRGVGGDRNVDAALSDFRRFPSWMWRNREVAGFVEWLKSLNDMRSPAEKVGFYGLDLYSLHSSMGAVLRYLDRADPAAAGRARERYSCFDHFGPDAQVYGFMTRLNLSKTCEREVLEQLKELQHVRRERAKIQAVDGEEAFHAEQNARLIKNAEAYYRSMYLEEVSTWNLRDRHMMETLATLEKHLSQDGRQAKIAVWAHNSHIGDARATEMGRRGELTLGQLAREAYGDDAVLIGFTTHRGTVRAASRWDGEAEIKRVRPALPGSYEAEFHDRGARGFLLVWDEVQMRVRERIEQMLERAIGVIYRPETERQSHYFHCAMAGQFDAVLHFDETKAVEALEEAPSRHEEVPETFPFGV